MVLVLPMPSAAAMASARMIGGKHKTRSVKRISASSTKPRAQAATMPTVTPIAAPSSTTEKPAKSERRAP